MHSFIRKLHTLDENFVHSPISNLALLFAAICMCCFWLLFPVDIQLYMPDTNSYLRFDSYRGAGYPIFLGLLKSLNMPLEYTPIVQTILFYGCLYFLCVRFSKFYSSFVFSLALMIGIGMNPAIVRYCFTLITESLFFSSLFILLGILFSRPDKSGNIILFLIGICISWLILIKPVSWSFICIPVLLIWQAFVQKNKALLKSALFILGFLIIFSAGSLYRYNTHQQWAAGSFLGNQLIGKLAFSKFEPSQTPYPKAAEHWLILMQPIHQARNNFLTEDYQRFLFALNMYDYLRFSKMPEIIALMNIEPIEEGAALTKMAFSIIEQNPTSYLYDVYLNFYNLWSIGELQSHKNSVLYNKQLNALKEVLGPNKPTPYYLNEHNSIKPIIVKPFLFIAFALNIGIILFCLVNYIFRLKGIPNPLNVLFILSCSTHAYFLLTALLQAALTRYAVVAWPIHVIIVLACCILLFNKLKQTEE